jgi:hypothetical protein
MAHYVTCRVCKEKFDARPEEKGIAWIMPSKNFYYHLKCYNDFKNKAALTSEDGDWVGLIYDYLARDLKVDYNYYMCEKQRESFVKKNKFTNKGIFFALKYFYEVKHGDWSRGGGGIGIIPFIYEEACNYWVNKEAKETGIIARIEQQMRELQKEETVKVTRRKPTTRKGVYNLDDILKMGDI